MAEIAVEIVGEATGTRSICRARVRTRANAWSNGGDDDRREGLENESSMVLSVLDPPSSLLLS